MILPTEVHLLWFLWSLHISEASGAQLPWHWSAGAPWFFYQFQKQIKSLKAIPDSDPWSLVTGPWYLFPDNRALVADLQTLIPEAKSPGPLSCLQSLDSAGPREAVMWPAGTCLTTDGSTVTLWVTVASCWFGTALSIQQEQRRSRRTWSQVLDSSPRTYGEPVSSCRLLQRSIIWPKPKHKTPWGDSFSVTFPGCWEFNKNNTPSSCCHHQVARSRM